MFRFGSSAKGSGGSGDVRKPAVAGQFYSADADELAGAVRTLLADALPPVASRPVALISPHAGYVYSGQIAADAWRQAAAEPVDVIVFVGTNHRFPGFDGAAVDPAGAYETPLGRVPVDRELAAELVAADDRIGFEPRAHSHEHSVEVQVPFAQHLFPDTPIVSTVLGSPDWDVCRRFGEVLAERLAGRRALLVASSDLSHYPGYQDAVTVDGRTLEAMASLDPERVREATRKGMRGGVPQLATCACGEAPVLATMVAARGLGATSGAVVSYANSGDTLLGEPERVVGYGAVVFAAGECGKAMAARPGRHEPARPESTGRPLAPELDAEDRRTLLEFARKVVEQFLTTGTAPLPRGMSPALSEPGGAFVTLHVDGKLRGCSGNLQRSLPLAHVVGAMAIQSAVSDPRFAAVRASELPGLHVEVSVLSPLVLVSDPADIVPGRDGLYIRKSGRRGVLLPQVAERHGWSRETYLAQVCRKAGLPEDGWREGAELLVFRALVFGEKEGTGG